MTEREVWPPSFGAPPDDVAETEELFATRTVELAFHRTRTRFELARTVFSSANVDPGSALLLRHLQGVGLGGVRSVLDVGCGHGTLGIVLKALDPDRRVTFVDRDALACRYTARNLRLNELGDGCEVLGSLGYDELTGSEEGVAPGNVTRGTDAPAPAGAGAERRFDAIVSNIPGKVGDGAMTELVVGAALVAEPGALLGFVVVVPLAERLRQLVGTPVFEPVLDTGNKTHVVVIVRVAEASPGPAEASGFERGCYDRGLVPFEVAKLSWTARTVAGLDEFDTLAEPTRLLRQALQGVRSVPALVVNPGQGHRAVVAALSGYRPAVLLSRDLLSLRASVRCLADAGVDTTPHLVHDITGRGHYGQADLTILHAEDKVHGPWLAAEVTGCLDEMASQPSGGRSERQLVLTGRSGLLGRLEADLLRRRPGHVAYKKSVRGHRVLRFVVG